MPPDSEVKSTGDTTFLLEQTEAPQAESSRESTLDQSETKGDSNASQPRANMSSGHTEPTQQHTKDELMHPGRDHHLTAPPCPDPSVHRNTKLQEQASTAALYVTKPKKSTDSILDANNKLSSRSAATSLKYARPEDLPSYPVVGINTAGSANSAANLANKNHTNFEHWKPDASASASKAAMLAKDYKMAPLWKPEMSAAGSKAALLAHKDGGKLDLWMPSASAEGNSAATLAMRQKSSSPQLDYGYTDEGRKRALMAATGAVSRSKSQKETVPPPVHPAYPDSFNSVHNALNAATVANKPSPRKANPDSNAIDSNAMRAARVQNYGANVDRQMFTERPPVEIELEEKRKQAALRASAVSMAKQMYDVQEKKRRDDEAADVVGMGSSAATAVHNRGPSSSSAAPPDLKQQAMQYIHLQEAAQKLAQERLAKLDPDAATRYRAHYGYEAEPYRNRLSLRGRPRKRADSEATQQTYNNDDDSSDDEFTARRIRNQTHGLNSSVAEVDAKKRAADRASLFAAAERKVQAQMGLMDEKVFQETGKVSPAMMEEWEAKARARAAADSEIRQKNFGKVNIGGGRYMDQSELDAIAQSRLQPTLNEINATAEKKRAADEERRLDEEQRKRALMSEKEREREVKNEQKRLRAEEKAAAKTHRAEEKAAEKARKADEKQAKREDKRRSKEVTRDAADGAAVSAAAHETTQAEVEPPRTPVITTTAPTDVVNSPSSTAPAISIAEPAIDRVRTNESKASAFSNADGTMRPELERHVSTVLTSSSESSVSSLVSSLSSHEDEVEHAAVTSTNTAVNTTAAPAGDHEAARAVAERAMAPAVVAEPALDKPVVTTGAKAEAEEEALSSSRRKSKGFTGFFGKFKRDSRTPGTIKPMTSAKGTSAINATAPATAAATSTTASSTGITAATPADGTADLSDSASESSFRRHEHGLRRISSLSSSSSDEEGRGRTGKASTKFANKDKGKGKGKARGGIGGGKTGMEDLSDSSDDEGAFEEARDTFDESLAPPAPEGQRKSSSPVRETKFVEEL